MNEAWRYWEAPMNKTCEECQASLACVTDVAYMMTNRSTGVDVFVPGRHYATLTLLCHMPENCPRRYKRDYRGVAYEVRGDRQ